MHSDVAAHFPFACCNEPSGTRHGRPEILVQGEGEGVAAYGKGVEGFYVDPGKTLVIKFNNHQPGKHAFRCDLHPTMKGEAYVMEVPVA